MIMLYSKVVMNVGADSGRVSVWVWASFPRGIGIGQSTPRDLEILHFYYPLPQDLVQKVEVFAHVSGEDLRALECRQTLRVAWRLIHKSRNLQRWPKLFRAPELFIQAQYRHGHGSFLYTVDGKTWKYFKNI